MKCQIRPKLSLRDEVGIALRWIFDLVISNLCKLFSALHFFKLLHICCSAIQEFTLILHFLGRTKCHRLRHHVKCIHGNRGSSSAHHFLLHHHLWPYCCTWCSSKASKVVIIVIVIATCTECTGGHHGLGVVHAPHCHRHRGHGGRWWWHVGVAGSHWLDLCVHHGFEFLLEHIVTVFVNFFLQLHRLCQLLSFFVFALLS